MRGSGPTLRSAVLWTAVVALWTPAARAEEGSETRPAPKTKSISEREMDLWKDVNGAIHGWIRDPGAEVEGVPLIRWLSRLASRDPAEATAARRVFSALGRDAYPWLAVGLESASRPALHVPCAELASALTTAAKEDLGALAMDVSPFHRRVALAAARRTGLAEDARREALGDDDAVVRREAATSFLLASAVKPETVAVLEAALADSDVRTRLIVALVLLRAGGPPATRLVASLERPEVRERYPAMNIVGLPAEAGDAVLPLFASPSWHVRSHGAMLLAFSGTISPRAVAALTAALGDPSGAVRWRVACALDRPEARGAEPALRERLSDDVPDVRAAAAVALATLGSVDEAALPPLVAALGNAAPSGWFEDFQTLLADVLGPRWYLLVSLSIPAERLATALGRHGPAGVAAVRASAESVEARRNAVTVYDAAGAAGDEALRASLSDAEEEVRRAAALALARRGDARAEVVTVLADRVGWGSWVNGRNERLDALLSLGSAALPALRTLIAKDDHDLRPGVAAALVALGPRAAPAVPELLRAPLDAIEVLPGEKESTTSIFEKAIRSIGAAARDGLVEGIASEDPDVRERAFRGCLYLGPLAKPALPALREALTAKRIPGYEDVPATDPIRPIE